MDITSLVYHSFLATRRYFWGWVCCIGWTKNVLSWSERQLVFHRLFLRFYHLRSLFLSKPFCFLFPGTSYTSTYHPLSCVSNYIPRSTIHTSSSSADPQIESTLRAGTLFWSPLYSQSLALWLALSTTCLLSEQVKGLTQTLKMSHRISCHHLHTGLTLVSPLPTRLTHMKARITALIRPVLQCLS